MSVYKDKARGTWTVYYRCKDWTGKVKQITKRGFKTKREGIEWELDSRQKTADSMDMTLANFTNDVYLSEIKARIKLSTFLTKENIIKSQILPYLGNLKMSEITSAVIIRWQNTLISKTHGKTDKHFSKSYLKTVHTQLVAILNYAVRHYGLKNNAAAMAGNMGTDRGIEMKFWTLCEYKLFSATMMDKPIFYYAFQVLYWCGLREGELFALTIRDIDFSSKTISVNKTYMRHNGEDIFTPPKTLQSIRTVTIPDFLVVELEDYIKLYYQKSPTERLFPVTKAALTRALKTGAREAGVKEIRVHDLRHSHVSLLINKGVTPLAIAKRVGHSSIDITYRYAHLFPNAQASIANDLDKLNSED